MKKIEMHCHILPGIDHHGNEVGYLRSEDFVQK